MAQKAPFRVLSIDGGGMRGIYTAEFLDILASRLAAKHGRHEPLDIGKGFNLIAGTSTGAIIACALAAGVPLRSVVTLYRKSGKKIFPLKLKSNFWQVFRKWAVCKGRKALQAALQAALGKETVGDVWVRRGIALAIPAVEMSHYHPWIFKTPHLASSTHRDDAFTLADVCLATTAAPIYRSLAAIRGQGDASHVFVDGGLWANSPVLMALIEAVQMTEPGDRIEIFSIGTCPRPEGQVIEPNDIDWGLLRWRFGGDAAAISIAAQESAFDFMAKFFAKQMDRDIRIIRFPKTTVPASILPHLDLDATSAGAMTALVAQAHRDVDETTSACGRPDDEAGVLIDALFRTMPDLPPVEQTAASEGGASDV